MLVLSDYYVGRLEDLFKSFMAFEDRYNRDSSHYPSSIYFEIKKFCKDLNDYNQKIDFSKIDLSE